MPLTDSKFTATTDLASPDGMTEMLRQETLLKTGALQKAIFNSANFSSIATDANGVIQIFNVGAERMLGYTALEVLNKITPADISDPQEVIARAKALSIELGTQIEPGFEALVFKASRGIEDIYELTYIRKDGSRFPAVVSVTALRDDQDVIIGYLLIGTDNTARKGAEAARLTSEARLDGLITSALDAIIAIDSKHCVTLFNTSAENMFGYKAADVLGASLDRLLPARFRAVHNNHINQFDATGFSKRLMGKAGEILGLHADGHEFPIEASISQLEVNGEKMFTVMLRDITERKKAEEALLKAGALQSAIFNSANFSSIATDAKGVIQIFNVGAERMLGYAALEVMNKITPADISDPQEVIARAQALSLELGTKIEPGFEALVFKASRGIEDIYELTYIRKDGSRFPAIVSVTALRDDQDTIIGYLLIGTDNTARKQAEEALLKAGALQSAIFNSANFSSIATDAKGVIQIFNVGAERMLGYAALEVMNKITPADISDPQEVIARARALSVELGTQIEPGFEALVFKASRGIEDIYELTYIRKDGSRFPAIVSVTALRDEQDIIIGYLLIGTDNTARKLAEEALVKVGALQTAILTSANFSIIATDEKGIIQLFNVGAEQMLGYHAEEVVNKINPSDIHDPEEVMARAHALSLELETTITPGFEALVFKASRGIEDIYELTYIRKDGGRFPAIVSVTALRDDDRNIIGYLLIGTDNSVRKRVELALKDAMVLAEKANLAKTHFLSNMSHELRTPLSAILGFAQLIESGNPEPTPAQKRSVDQILKAGWYLLELINEILDLALIESGKLSLSLEPVLLSEVMQECDAMVEAQAAKRGIQVTFPHFAELCFVKADRTRLKQVLINILSNAIKYNRQDGTVTVSCVHQGGERIRICVEDTGLGLSFEKIAQLFQPFNRLGQEAHAEQGTGIGLVMTKRLTELMGGVIGVKSVVGEGSIFWVELGLTTQHVNLPQMADTAPPNTLQSQPVPYIHTLLYVEDNPANLLLIENLIERRPDIRLLTARDGYSGVSMAQTALPDAILMDINLPGISGLQALQLLRTDSATAHIPVVALSANAMPRDITKGMEAGFFKYLTKPIKIDEFMQTLDAVLNFASIKAAIKKTDNS